MSSSPGVAASMSSFLICLRSKELIFFTYYPSYIFRGWDIFFAKNYNTLKNFTRVNSSIELTQFMKSIGSIHDLSYI